MFSYQHRYHAGNFADVHKHLTLLGLLEHFKQKNKPYAVLDLNAGEGFYNLKSAESQKTDEYKKGILPLLNCKEKKFPPLIQEYLSIIKAFPTLSYPGSPSLIAHYLNDQDRALFVEKHPKAISQLKYNFGKYRTIHLDKQINIHERDSWEALNALTPFSENRGIIFCDPSYEVKNEYDVAKETIIHTLSKTKLLTLALWYPLLPQAPHQSMVRDLIKASDNVWQSEWYPYPQLNTGLYASGLLVINPPWQLNQHLNSVFRWLNQHVYPGGILREKLFVK